MIIIIIIIIIITISIELSATPLLHNAVPNTLILFLLLTLDFLWLSVKPSFLLKYEVIH